MAHLKGLIEATNLTLRSGLIVLSVCSIMILGDCLGISYLTALPEVTKAYIFFAGLFSFSIVLAHAYSLPMSTLKKRDEKRQQTNWEKQLEEDIINAPPDENFFFMSWIQSNEYVRLARPGDPIMISLKARGWVKKIGIYVRPIREAYVIAPDVRTFVTRRLREEE